MKINIGQQHSAFGETHWRRFSRWFGPSRGSGLSTVTLLIAVTITGSGSSAASDKVALKGKGPKFRSASTTVM